MAARRPKIPRHVIFFHILPRLPLYTLQQNCMIVCKQWHKFLKTRMFTNLHNRHLTSGSTLHIQPRLLFLSRENPLEFCYLTPDDGMIPQRHPLPFDARYISSLTSLHGLVCVCLYKKDEDRYSDLILWNPLTGKHKTLCKTNPYLKLNFSKKMSLGLYYNAADDDYKLLVLSSYDLSVYTYSLKSDSWRNIDSTENYQALSHFQATWYWTWALSNGVWLNGNLYFLYFIDDDIRNRKKGPFVIKFDTKSEKFSVIPTHPSLMDLDVKHVSMNVEKGVIYLGVKYEMGRYAYSTNAYIQMWRMIDDDGNWEKVEGRYKVDSSLEPMEWIENKTWLMIKDKTDMYKVDYNKGTCIKVDHTDKISNYHTVIVRYTESFMSPDRSILR